MTSTDAHPGNRTTRDPQAVLPLWPWHDLRPSTGMLLGVDDFDVLGGGPRARRQLHNAWLHGSGVVWGFGVRPHGEWQLAVAPGLAVDGWGRELHLDAPACISFKDLVEEDHDETCPRREVEVCLVARFDSCLDAPVPALADPCDVTRQSEEYSRVVSRVRLELVRGRPPAPSAGFHRVRVLLGLDVVRGEDDEAGREALCRRNEVLAAPAHARARELRWHVRCLAALDVADLRPAGQDCERGLFPVAEQDAGVLLGCLRLTVGDQSGCPDILDACLDTCGRPTIVPTTVIQDLLCGLAPGLIGACDSDVGVGPQAVPGSIDWNENHREFSFEVTDAVLPATLTRDSVIVTSLSARGWIVEDLDCRPHYRAKAGRHRVRVRLADRPGHPLIRVLVRGTGPTPVYGADPPAPFAGVVGDDPGLTGQGRDAVLTSKNPACEGVDEHESRTD